MMSSVAIQKMDLKDIGNILEILSGAKKIYIMGNGGSAATALHFALDLNKAAGLNAVCLNGNPALISAFANDDGYESIFASQLERAERFDVLVAISCSGNSQNVLRAVRYAKDFSKMPVIGFTGDEGGKLAEEAEFLVKVPNPDIKIQEDAHLALCHAITQSLEK